MEPNKPYCYLYKVSVKLYVSTVVQLEANESLKPAKVVTLHGKTTITYEVYTPPVGGPAKVHTPPDEEIPWGGSGDWTVVVVIDNGGTEEKTTMHANDIE